MNTKKWLAVGTCVTALGLFSACSDDETSPVNAVSEPSSSSAITPNSSGDIATSSSDISTGSSSSVKRVRTKDPSEALYILNFMCFCVLSRTWMKTYLSSGDQLMLQR